MTKKAAKQGRKQEETTIASSTSMQDAEADGAALARDWMRRRSGCSRSCSRWAWPSSPSCSRPMPRCLPGRRERHEAGGFCCAALATYLRQKGQHFTRRPKELNCPRARRPQLRSPAPVVSNISHVFCVCSLQRKASRYNPAKTRLISRETATGESARALRRPVYNLTRKSV